MLSFWSIPIEAFASSKGREYYEKTGNVFWKVNTKEKLVSITFDDGPHPVFTPIILDILAKYQAKATFFVTGTKAETYPNLIRREMKEGHEIANHTYNHYIKRNISVDKLTSELEQTDIVLKKIAGYTPALYRPVGGIYNETIINTALKNGKLVILWSWDPRDWNDPPASRITKLVTKAIKPGDIIVLHDWHGTELSQSCQTVLALDDILEYLNEHGYKCVTVSELIFRSKMSNSNPIDPLP